MVAKYVPDAGEVVRMQFDPQAGHEQAGHRPALVLSAKQYNEMVGLLVCCPMTTKIKGYPFEVQLDSQPGSAVLADQVKSLDWRAREATKKGRVTATELESVRVISRLLIG